MESQAELRQRESYQERKLKVSKNKNYQLWKLLRVWFGWISSHKYHGSYRGKVSWMNKCVDHNWQRIKFMTNFCLWKMENKPKIEASYSSHRQIAALVLDVKSEIDQIGYVLGISIEAIYLRLDKCNVVHLS